MARPSKLTEQTMTKLCEGLALGATYELACKYAGISSSTLRYWRLRAERTTPGSALRQSLARLDDAEGKAAVRWLAQIEQAARAGAWQASAWRLERRYPQDYGRQILQHDGTVQLTTQPEWLELRQVIVEAMAPYPEAAATLAEVLHDARNGTRA